MNRRAIWGVSIAICIPLLVLGYVIWHVLKTDTQKQVLSRQTSTTSDNTSASSLSVGSGSGTLGDLGQGTSSANSSNSSSISANNASPQITFGSSSNNAQSSSTNNGSSTNSNSESATLDPAQFGVYEKYKTAQNALFADITTGSGEVAASGKTLYVNYKGWLTNGTVFDQNLDSSKPFNFTLGAGTVIKGWDQGLSGMKIGGERLVIIPPEFGYGASGQGTIPPNAVLVFYVKLLAIK